MAVQLTLYLNEADRWQRKPLHLEVLNYLRQEGVCAALAFHAVAGFIGHQRVKTATMAEAGGKLPVIITFVDTDEHVTHVLPKLKEMAPNRLIIKENVAVEQGTLE